MPAFDERRLEMSKEELHLLRDVFQEACGFVLREDLKFVAERRLAPRLEALGLQDFRAYHRYLRFDPKGHDGAGVGHRSAGAARDLLLPRADAARGLHRGAPARIVAQGNAAAPSLRLWSAGCSTGEEPYTLSMLLDEAAAAQGWDIDVLGTDLSRRALATARHAEYGPAALRATTAGAAAALLRRRPTRATCG